MKRTRYIIYSCWPLDEWQHNYLINHQNSALPFHLGHVFLHIDSGDLFQMMPDDIFAVLCYKHIEVGGVIGVEGLRVVLFACEQGGKVFLDGCQAVHELEAGLFEVIQLFQKVPILDAAGALS